MIFLGTRLEGPPTLDGPMFDSYEKVYISSVTLPKIL